MGQPSLWGDRARRRGLIGLILWDHEAVSVGPHKPFPRDHPWCWDHSCGPTLVPRFRRDIGPVGPR